MAPGARSVQRLGRRVVNLSLAGQFGARRAPVGLHRAAGRACRPSPCRPAPSCGPTLVARTLVAPFALATELRARQGASAGRQLSTSLLEGFAPGQPAVLDPQGRHRAALARIDTDARSVSRRSTSGGCNASFDTRASPPLPHAPQRVPGPTPLRFPVPRLAVRLDRAVRHARGIRAALLFLVKPGPDLRSARRTSNRKAARARNRARRRPAMVPEEMPTVLAHAGPSCQWNHAKRKISRHLRNERLRSVRRPSGGTGP